MQSNNTNYIDECLITKTQGTNLSDLEELTSKNSRNIILLFKKTLKSKSEIPKVETEQVPDQKTNVRS